MVVNRFVKALEELGFSVGELELKRFELYYNYLVEKNKVMNLTGITDLEGVYFKHFYDSLTIIKAIDKEDITLCDVGSGAGFPSIPLAIMMPNIKVTIIDALNKRIKFLNEVIDLLKLDNVVALHYRAEDYVKIKRSSFDIACARAVANMPMLCELCMPLVKIGGKFIAMKGSSGQKELDEAKNAIKVLGGEVSNVYELELINDLGSRCIISVKRTKECNKMYPRLFKNIKEKPL